MHKQTYENSAICWDELKGPVGASEKDSVEKSGPLFNQQETQKGSSETYTQSSLNVQEGKEQAENSARPSHKKAYTTDFIDWLVGFTEGDGSFEVKNETQRVSFIITQKDPKVLYFIKKELGYGQVYECKDTYWRYTVSSQEQIGYLIQLFTGQLRLEKTNRRFEAWVEAYSKYNKLKERITVERGVKKIDNNTAWLSGFIDAEGSFSAAQRSGRTTFRMKFSIKQKGEHETMKQLLLFAGPNEKWGTLSKRGDIGILEVDSIVRLRPLIKYIGKYPLHSQKGIAYVRWLKLLRVVEEGGRGKDYETIKKMAQSINQHKEEDKVHILEKD